MGLVVVVYRTDATEEKPLRLPLADQTPTHRSMPRWRSMSIAMSTDAEVRDGGSRSLRHEERGGPMTGRPRIPVRTDCARFGSGPFFSGRPGRMRSGRLEPILAKV